MLVQRRATSTATTKPTAHIRRQRPPEKPWPTPRSRGPGKRVSCLREHEEGDRHVLAGKRNDDEGMEDLVVAEDPGKGSGLASRIDERADGVGDPAGDQQRRRPDADRSTIWRTTITDTQPSATQVAATTQAGASGRSSLLTWRWRRRPRRPPGSAAATRRRGRAGRTACRCPRSARRSSRGRGTRSTACAPRSNHGDGRGAETPEHEHDARREHDCTDLCDTATGVQHEHDPHRHRDQERGEMPDPA